MDLRVISAVLEVFASDLFLDSMLSTFVGSIIALLHRSKLFQSAGNFQRFLKDLDLRSFDDDRRIYLETINSAKLVLRIIVVFPHSVHLFPFDSKSSYFAFFLLPFLLLQALSTLQPVSISIREIGGQN